MPVQVPQCFFMVEKMEQRTKGKRLSIEQEFLEMAVIVSESCFVNHNSQKLWRSYIRIQSGAKFAAAPLLAFKIKRMADVTNLHMFAFQLFSAVRNHCLSCSGGHGSLNL